MAASGFLPLVEMTGVGSVHEYRSLAEPANRHFDRREKSRGGHALIHEFSEGEGPSTGFLGRGPRGNDNRTFARPSKLTGYRAARSYSARKDSIARVHSSGFSICRKWVVRAIDS